MKIIIEVKDDGERIHTNLEVEECFTNIDKGMAMYFAEKFKAAIDEMYDGAAQMAECEICKTIMLGTCPDCGNEIGRII